VNAKYLGCNFFTFGLTLANCLSMDITLHLNFEEKDLIKACIRKERWAQKKLYEEHYSKMMGVCLRYSNSQEDALDILHEGFIKVFKNISKYQPGTSISAWIRRIMINTSIDFYRKSIRRRTEDIEQAYDLSASEADAISQCSEKEILQVVQQLSPAYRAVFNLYVIEGYSHKEIAKILDITESTSRSNLVKARMKLKAILKSRFFGYGG
jgi:RNA polymerase sigma-70 factor (ECF subfamily)